MSSRVAFTTQRLSQVLCHFPKSLAIQQSGRQFTPSGAFASLNRHSKENMKEKVVVIGTGWAGWTISQDLDDKQYDITVISPERTLALTPLLASAACGIFEFRQSEEPVRRQHRSLQKYQAKVEDIDFSEQTLTCRTAVTTHGLEYENETEFKVPYDRLILSPGCQPNDFGTPGVQAHAFFLKSALDASNIRARVLDLFELACLPYVDIQKKKELLHIAVVGGGPTGVEMAAEVDDLVNDHLYKIYPQCRGLVSINIYDVAPKILSGFEAGLQDYALKSFQSRDSVEIKVGSHITKVEKDALFTKEEGRIPCGMLVWATGNKQVPLIDNLNEVKKAEKTKRILTDRYLRVFKNPDTINTDADSKHESQSPAEQDSNSPVFPNVYALGDAADIETQELPTTAEVAVQKAKYLCRILNLNSDIKGLTLTPFSYEQKNTTAYLGRQDGVIAGKEDRDWTGSAAWLAWRGGSLQWTRSWRRKVVIWVAWVLNYLDGREIARK